MILPLQKNRAIAVFTLAASILSISLCAALAFSHTMEFVFALFIALLLLGAIACVALDQLFLSEPEEEKARTKLNFASMTKTICASIAGAVLLEALTLFGSPSHSPLNLADWSIKQTMMFLGISFAICVGTQIAKEKAPEYLRAHKPNKKTVISLCVCAALSLCLAFPSGFAIHSFLGLSLFPASFYCFALLFCISSCIVLFRKKAPVEQVFLSIALSVGLCIAVIPPAQSGISWDDQIHYERSLTLSYLVNTGYTEADLMLFDPHAESESISRLSIEDWSESSINSFDDELNTVYESGEHFEQAGFSTPAPNVSSIMSFSSIGYIPSAIGLWTARLFHLPLSIQFVVGRIFNLLAYIAVCYFAIKMCPLKKTLMACISILPTGLLLASSYSYDPWLTSFCLLAVAITLKESTEEGLISIKRILILLLLFLVALGPKAIYFPLVGLLFLIPKKRFSSLKCKRYFNLAVIALGFLVVLSFLVPFLSTNGGGGGDMRGGSDVNTVEQMKFILSNPFEYAHILAAFLMKSYLNLQASAGYTLHFAYLGQIGVLFPYISYIPIVILIVTALLDSNAKPNSLSNWGARLWMLFIFITTVILVATSLYVSFTPVALNTINGVQERYLIPLLFPALALCLNFNSISNSSQQTFSYAQLSFFGLLGFICTAFAVLSKMTA